MACVRSEKDAVAPCGPELICLDSSQGDSDGTVVLSDDEAGAGHTEEEEDKLHEAGERQPKVEVKEEATDIPEDDQQEGTEASSAAQQPPALEEAPQQDLSQPLVRVTFRDVSCARKYGAAVERMLMRLLSPGAETEDKKGRGASASAPKLTLELWEDFVMDCGWQADSAPPPSCTKHLPKDASATSAWDVPTYSKAFTGVLQEGTKEEQQAGTGHRGKGTCFNCGGDHRLPECKVPRNAGRIARNRRAFGGSGGTAMRYHQEEVGRSMKPGGQLSAVLREALGLRPNQLPLHSYRMRLLGYPPGWLLEARRFSSGLALIQGGGDPAPPPTDLKRKRGQKEEGECEEEAGGEYDPEAIVDFPGFNVPAPAELLDESSFLGMPPFSPRQLKEAMLAQLAHQQPKPRAKRLRSSPAITLVDMELEDATVSSTVGQLHPAPPGEEGGVASSQPKQEGVEKRGGAAVVHQHVQGTPIPPPVSPFCSVPDISRFSLGMGPMEFFQNLPDSTGKSRDISSLLQQVRCRMARVQASSPPKDSLPPVFCVEDDDDEVQALDAPTDHR